MQTENRQRFVLSEKNEADIRLFCEIANENGSSISIGEMISLISVDATEEELERAWPASSLSDLYELVSGMIVEKGPERTLSEIHGEKIQRFSRAESNIDFAKRFVGLFDIKNPLVFSISGSTSYQSVSKEDDLDFFCITKNDTTWIFLTKALLLARAFRFAERDSPWICLSYVMDENYSVSEFTLPKDGLFARDALSTIVLRGSEYYQALIRNCYWMGEYFPKMYKYRTQSKGGRGFPATTGKLPSSIEMIVNLFLYHIVGTYVRLKSYLLNRKFAKEHDRARQFLLLIGKDHCIYESLSYLKLRRMYSQLDPNSESLA